MNDTDLIYSIYKCIPDCNEEYNLKQSKENSLQCYKECPSNYPYKSKEEIICYDHCINSPNNKFTLIREDEDGIEYSRECSDKCDNPNDSNPNKRIYYGDDKVCQKNCSEYIYTPTPISNYNYKCVSKCDLTSTYKFQLENICVDKCDNIYKRYSKGDYICKKQYGENENIVTIDNQCVSTVIIFRIH